MTAKTHDRLIGRLPDDDRRAILDALANSSHGQLVAVEQSYERKLELAKTTVGKIVGVAYSPSGACATVLVLEPADTTKRMVAISAAHVLRVRAASPWGKEAPGRYRLGEVLAGPPLTQAVR